MKEKSDPSGLAPSRNAFRWACPACRSAVPHVGAVFECTGCARTFDAVSGSPDFRLSVPRYIDRAADLSLARKLADSDLPLDQLVRSGYAQRDDPARVELRTREVLSASEELHSDLRGWLKAVAAGGPFLDLGCGAGMLMAAASDLQPGLQAIGIDASMAWLVVAQKYVRDHGGDPILAAAMAEALPFGD